MAAKRKGKVQTVPEIPVELEGLEEVQQVLGLARRHLQDAEDIFNSFTTQPEEYQVAQAHSQQAHALLMYGSLLGVLMSRGD